MFGNPFHDQQIATLEKQVEVLRTALQQLADGPRDKDGNQMAGAASLLPVLAAYPERK